MTLKKFSDEELATIADRVSSWAEFWLHYKGDGELKAYLVAGTAMDPPTNSFNPYDEAEDYSDEKGKDLVVRAVHKDRDADAALCSIAHRHISVGKPLPPNLAGYILDVLRSRINGHKQGSAHVARNLFVVEAVARLRDFGVQPTRNRKHFGQSPYTSGCAMVAHGLKLEEKAVQDIWDDRPW